MNKSMILSFLAIAAAVCAVAGQGGGPYYDYSFPELTAADSQGGGTYDLGFPGPGFNIPGFGVDPTTVVCSDDGPCFNMTLKCPDSCFTSFSRSGQGFSYGGGGGGCSFDCKTNCTASC